MSNEPTTQRAPLLGGLVSALRTLTILPIPGREAASPAAALAWFPLVGLLLGGLIMLALQGIRMLSVPLAPGIITLTLLGLGTFLTRAFHLDGLADWADGWWGGYDRDRILAIMKDSHIGTFGVLALIFIVLAKLFLYTNLLAHGGRAWIPLSLVLGRMGMVDMAVANPYARSESGTAARFVQEARPIHWAIACAITVAILLPWPRIPIQHAALALASTLLVARLFGWRCRRRIGGVTGDILGAGNELIELTTLTLGVLLHSAV